MKIVVEMKAVEVPLFCVWCAASGGGRSGEDHQAVLAQRATAGKKTLHIIHGCHALLPTPPFGICSPITAYSLTYSVNYFSSCLLAFLITENML